MLLINRYWLNIAVLTANLVRAVWIVISIVTFVVPGVKGTETIVQIVM